MLNLELPGSNYQEHNEAYGDNYVAARYCGFAKAPKPIDGEWQHGWIIPERNIHPEFVIGSDGQSSTRKSKKYFVARKDQEIYLKKKGFTNVFAIGLPVVYLNQPDVTRINGTLLVMPVHSLSDTQENWDDEAYASYIHSIAGNFSEVVVCLHKSCIDKGNWVKAFSKRNYQIVLGADPNDSNSYERLSILFSRFEFVTTNEFGSQLAYAAFFGAKPSIAGPPPNFKRSDYKQTTFYRNAPMVLDIVDSWVKEGYYKKCYPNLYVEPHLAKDLKQWASFQLGQSEKKNPDQLLQLFGWTNFAIFLFKIKRVYHKIIKFIK